jgi:hypothetical protein
MISQDVRAGLEREWLVARLLARVGLHPEIKRTVAGDNARSRRRSSSRPLRPRKGRPERSLAAPPRDVSDLSDPRFSAKPSLTLKIRL